MTRTPEAVAPLTTLMPMAEALPPEETVTTPDDAAAADDDDDEADGVSSMRMSCARLNLPLRTPK